MYGFIWQLNKEPETQTKQREKGKIKKERRINKFYVRPNHLKSGYAKEHIQRFRFGYYICFFCAYLFSCMFSVAGPLYKWLMVRVKLVQQFRADYKWNSCRQTDYDYLRMRYIKYIYLWFGEIQVKRKTTSTIVSFNRLEQSSNINLVTCDFCKAK